MDRIDVELKGETDEGLLFNVEVNARGSLTEHEVTLKQEDYQRLVPEGEITPQELVEESFRFLLKRESNQSILGKFNLMDISDYFPEYEEEISSQVN